MAFELITWVYITLVCFAWGSLVAGFFFHWKADFPERSFPVVCFFGMLIIGMIAWYLSLFMPIREPVKLMITLPVLFYYLWPENRILLAECLRTIFIKMSSADLV